MSMKPSFWGRFCGFSYSNEIERSSPKELKPVQAIELPRRTSFCELAIFVSRILKTLDVVVETDASNSDGDP